MPAAEACAIEDSFGEEKLKTLFHGLAGEAGVAIAVSGGSDSTALMHLLRDWRGLTERGPKLVGLTVDHGLRKESAEEAQYVARQCARLGMEHHTLRWEGAKPASGIQAKARMARYDLMTAWCSNSGIGVLLTAHTVDDQAETVLMRSSRSDSAESLAGIWPERPWNNVRLRRPLLGERRNALRRYLAAKGVAWIEDPSNANETFERVRVRRMLASAKVPELAAKAEEAQAEVLATAERVRGFLARNGQLGPAGEIRLASEAIVGLAAGDRLALSRALIVALRGAVWVERAELARLAQWLGGSVEGRRTLAGLMFQKKRHELVIGREPGRIPALWLEIRGQARWDQRFIVSAPPGAKVGPALLAPEIGRIPGMALWVQQGLPVVELATGQRVLAIPSPESSQLEQLGIALRPTYVNALEGLPVA